MTPKEQAAMQQALEALEELHYSSGTVVAARKYELATAALREALAEQAEQEPVAWWFQPPNKNVRPMFDTQQHGGKWKPLYAAPVQQVDLTDDEIYDVADKYNFGFPLDVARAVIAADREKNK